jgi:hypothetical protein
LHRRHQAAAAENTAAADGSEWKGIREFTIPSLNAAEDSTGI